MASADPAAVYSLLANTQTFKGRSFRIASIYNNHLEEKCFRIETDLGLPVYKVRLEGAANKLSVKTEYQALRTLQQHGVAWTPRIYEFHADDPSYLIIEYEEGESLDKSLQWVSLADSIVAGLDRILADIHKITGEYFGHLAGPRYSSWRQFLDARFWHHVRLVIGAGLISESDIRIIRALYDETIEDLSTVRPALLHGDVKPANIVFDADHNKVILVDFEIARFGDIDFEWMRLHHLSQRWSEYRQLIAQPLLTRAPLTSSGKGSGQAKRLFYTLYHICSLLAFECELKLAIPKYRLDDLAEALRTIRLRKE